MASHGHHHHHHCFATPAAVSSCSCCCGCSCSPPQPPPATATTDPLLLQAIAAQLLQSQPPPIYSHQYFQSLHHQYPNPSPPPPAPEPQLYKWHQKQTSQYPHREKNQQRQGHKDLVESLVRRISALESSLPQTNSCSALGPEEPQTALPQPNRADRPRREPLRRVPPRRLASSVRDAAARTIQTQFRLFLIRRSQILRDLKHLAAIRSEIAALKSSLRLDTREPHLLGLKALQSRVVDLLKKLDCIQSFDPMIREGKRSIRLELLGITELTDGAVKRLIPDFLEEQQAQLQQFSKPDIRRVTFIDGSNEGESRSSDDLDEIEEGGNDTTNDDNEILHRLKNLGKNGGKSGLHAPLPVKMESRRMDSDDNPNGN